ncbi:MAG: hypothetical protein I3J00_11465 [Mesosutterella multiformis]|nr:hypothetical protein [Mesosutterella multiformis]
MAFGQKVLSRVKSALMFDPRSDAPVTRRVAFVIEPNTETEGKAPEAGAAISGAAELILRVETAAQAIWGAEAHVVSLGDTGVPLSCGPTRVEVKIEARARSEGEMKHLISLLREEARVICDRRRLIITEEQISERVVKPGTPEPVIETVTEETRVYGV